MFDKNQGTAPLVGGILCAAQKQSWFIPAFLIFVEGDST
jgi:hypothetical protein